MALEREMAVYFKALPVLLGDTGNTGKFVLIHGDDVVGTWATEEEALEAGYERFGDNPFLVKEIAGEDRPRYFSRHITCP